MDNIIYLYAADENAKGKVKAIAQAANENFAKMGLKNIRVQVYKGKFNSNAYGKLDKTDAIAVIGNRDNVLKVISDFNPKHSETLKGRGFGLNGADRKYNPEDSQNPRDNPTGGPSDNIIAIGAEATKSFAVDVNSSFEEAAGFLINHGAGHLSNLNHAGHRNRYDDQGNIITPSDINVPSGPNIMEDGGILAGRIKSGRYGETLQTYITSPQNQQPPNKKESTLSIKAAYLHRFASPVPKANLPGQQ